MLQEYEDDLFFEEDKIKRTAKIQNVTEPNTVPSNLHDDHLSFSVNLEGPVMVDRSKVSSKDEDVSKSPEEICIFNDLRQERYMLVYQDLSGMTVTSGSVTLTKDEKNLIGISIGGGAPLCPCLYIVQIFDNTPASRDGTLQSGDELIGVNTRTVKGKTKVEVAKMIQSTEGDVVINYNKLHADAKQGKTLDIVMKKMKHRLVDGMSSGAADALGLSRAILCNDTLVAKLNELHQTETMYKQLVDHAKRMLKAYFDVLLTYKALGDAFAAIGVREPQPRASEAFSKFAGYHRQMDKDGIKMLKTLKPILADMGTYLTKAIPDTKLTIRKYADTKFEYLSYCLKVKEMDDEEHSFNSIQEPLYRVETGNYEYRLVLRCRQEARTKFAQLRSDVLVKMELLDNKKAQDVVYQLRRFCEGLSVYHNETLELLKEHGSLFPVEVDLSQNAFQYKSTTPYCDDYPEDEEEIEEIATELTENLKISHPKEKSEIKTKTRKPKGKIETKDDTEKLLPEISEPKSILDENLDETSENTTLLAELGLADTNISDLGSNFHIQCEDFAEFGNFQDGPMGDCAKEGENKDIDDVFDQFFSEFGQKQ